MAKAACTAQEDSTFANAKEAEGRILSRARRTLGCAHWRAMGELVIARQSHFTCNGRTPGNRARTTAQDAGESAESERAARTSSRPLVNA